MTWTRCHQKVLFSTLFCFLLVWLRSTTDGIKSNQVGSILGQSEPADKIMVAFDLTSSHPVVRVRFSFKRFYFRSSVPNTLLHPGPAKLNLFLLLLALSMQIPLHINSTSCLAFMFCFRKNLTGTDGSPTLTSLFSWTTCDGMMVRHFWFYSTMLREPVSWTTHSATLTNSSTLL